MFVFCFQIKERITELRLGHSGVIAVVLSAGLYIPAVLLGFVMYIFASGTFCLYCCVVFSSKFCSMLM